ncbi:MAG TPA: HisA/HisF-related TIM barrel protein [Thermoanaerobaculia bacterium]|nr:HisA/HisF-related TIM barrel protein [Thermoanaerobaculia bacterium]
MDLLPALDLRRGQAVRLRQGDDARATVHAGDAAAVLALVESYARAGARWVHVVDLDAALGEPPQRPLVERLLAACAGGPAIQLGGGLRGREAVEWALGAGCERVVLGSLLARDGAAFRALARRFPGRVVPALDVAAGVVRVAGWRQGAVQSLDELGASLAGLPCPAVLVTDVERDGMLGGPNLELTRRAARAAALPALLSGGVRWLADLEAAAAVPEIAGVVVGRALHEGGFDLAAAVELSQLPRLRQETGTPVAAAGAESPGAAAERPGGASAAPASTTATTQGHDAQPARGAVDSAARSRRGIR